MKVCIKCKVEKEDAEFRENRWKYKAGLAEMCRICELDYLQNIPSYYRKMYKWRGFTDLQIQENPEILETIKEIIKLKRLCKSKKQTQ